MGIGFFSSQAWPSPSLALLVMSEIAPMLLLWSVLWDSIWGLCCFPWLASWLGFWAVVAALSPASSKSASSSGWLLSAATAWDKPPWSLSSLLGVKLRWRPTAGDAPAQLIGVRRRSSRERFALALVPGKARMPNAKRSKSRQHIVARQWWLKHCTDPEAKVHSREARWDNQLVLGTLYGGVLKYQGQGQCYSPRIAVIFDAAHDSPPWYSLPCTTQLSQQYLYRSTEAKFWDRICWTPPNSPMDTLQHDQCIKPFRPQRPLLHPHYCPVNGDMIPSALAHQVIGILCDNIDGLPAEVLHRAHVSVVRHQVESLSAQEVLSGSCLYAYATKTKQKVTRPIMQFESWHYRKRWEVCHLRLQ